VAFSFFVAYAFFMLILTSFLIAAVQGSTMPPLRPGAELRTQERECMVKTQIESRGIHDRAVLAAIQAVPRHVFVPSDVSPLAYNDSPLPIGNNQTISQPYIVAFMTNAARLKPTDKVLEVGTGSGYQAAVLGELANEVYTVEIVKPLAQRAEEVLKKLNYKNIHTRLADGYQGWPEAAPFDVIFITAAPDHIPQPLIDQLRVGGRFILPVGGGSQHLLRLTKTADGLEQESLLPVSFVPMTGIAQNKR
jgi:protein-L-isoaspartate(D-aspartate) O-methyltransferase